MREREGERFKISNLLHGSVSCRIVVNQNFCRIYVRLRGGIIREEAARQHFKRTRDLHNFCPSPDDFAGCRRQELTQQLLFLCILSAMRVRRSCRDHPWRRRSEKFIERRDILMSHKSSGFLFRGKSLLKFYHTSSAVMAIIKHVR